jgi:hypothetical protein
MLGKEIHLLESLLYREPACAIADDHDVIGVVHDGFGESRNVFNTAHGGHRSGAMGGAMHDTGIKLDFALFVRETAVAHGILFGVVFDNSDRGDDGIERVAALLEDVHAFVEGMKAVGAGDDERALAGSGRCEMVKRKPGIPIRSSAAEELICASESAAG